MKMMKKCLTAVIICVMFCGATVMAGTYAAPGHAHVYSPGNYSLYNSYTISTHSYVSGWKVINGVSTEVYSDCHVVMFRYKAPLVCNCGATNGYDYQDDVQHMQCGE